VRPTGAIRASPRWSTAAARAWTSGTVRGPDRLVYRSRDRGAASTEERASARSRRVGGQGRGHGDLWNRRQPVLGSRKGRRVTDMVGSAGDLLECAVRCGGSNPGRRASAAMGRAALAPLSSPRPTAEPFGATSLASRTCHRCGSVRAPRAGPLRQAPAARTSLRRRGVDSIAQATEKQRRTTTRVSSVRSRAATTPGRVGCDWRRRHVFVDCNTSDFAQFVTLW
jgi:hypothetical protein